MRVAAAHFVALVLMLIGGTANAESGRFRPLDIYIDPAGQPLAAYQIELRVESGAAEIVGVEGGATTAFAKAPYYDPAALKGGRIILAAFSTAAVLPSQRTKVATVHMHETRTPVKYSVHLITAGNASGKRIDASATIGPQGEEP